MKERTNLRYSQSIGELIRNENQEECKKEIQPKKYIFSSGRDQNNWKYSNLQLNNYLNLEESLRLTG